MRRPAFAGRFFEIQNGLLDIWWTDNDKLCMGMGILRQKSSEIGVKWPGSLPLTIKIDFLTK